MGFKFALPSRKRASEPPSEEQPVEEAGPDIRAGNSLARIGLLLVIAGALLIAGVGYFFQHLAAQEVADARRQEVELVAENLADRIRLMVAERARKMEMLARDPVIIELAEVGSPKDRQVKEAELGYLFPEAVRVRILEPGLDEIDMQASPPISYAALDMLRQAETSDRPPPAEVHLFGTPQQHINMVRRILDASGRRIVGHLMVSFPLPMLQSAMESTRLPRGYGELRQVSSKGPLTLASRGDKSLRQGAPVVEVPIKGTRWQVAYWAEASGAATSLTGLLSVGGGAVALFALVTLLLLRWLQSMLKQDQTSLLALVRDARAGRLQGAYELQLEDCKPALHGLWRLLDMEMTASAPARSFSEALQKDGQAPAAAKSAAPAETPAAAPVPDDLTVLDDSVAAVAPAPATAAGPAQEKPAAAAVDRAIFRAYDIRGIAGQTLTADAAVLIGRAVAAEAVAQGETGIAVGRDGRLSSPELAEALIRGLREGGLNVVDIGLVPTPVLYFATETLDTRSGVMVTGSHNPAEYNGFKIVIAGETLADEGIQRLRTRIEQGDFTSGAGGLEQRDLLEDYLKRIEGDVQLAKPLKVVVDCGNGAAGVVAPTLLEALGCQVTPLYCEVDGSFPNHHPDPGKDENYAALIEAVQAQGADLGIAFDGDGDRLGVVDSEGRIIRSDRLMMLFAMDVLSRNPGADIIYDVKCSRHLGKIIRDFGGSPEMWRTGHSVIKARMKETGALLAGEMSGHIFFRERWYGFDDGIYAAARLLEILGNDHRASSAIFAVLPDGANTPEIQVCMEEGQPQDFMQRFIQSGPFEGADITTIDGLRADFPDGWGLVRASNTTPCLVLRFEADDEAALARIQEQFRNAMLAVDPSLDLPF